MTTLMHAAEQSSASLSSAVLSAALTSRRQADSYSSGPLGNKCNERIELVLLCFFFFSTASVLAVPNPFFISELLLAYESNREKMGQASRITGLSAGLLEFTDHIRMSPVPYGTTCPGHQESYADASILHSRNLDPNCDKCFKCMY